VSKKLTFIEEAEFKGFRYRPDGILGNGFYGNNLFISLTDMEKYSRFYNMQEQIEAENLPKINSEEFIACETKNHYYTNDIIDLFPDLKEHQLHNFLNRFKDVFLSQKLFTLNNRKRVFTKEAVKFIYNKLIRKEDDQKGKKRGRKTT
jgi:hypothetical protein